MTPGRQGNRATREAALVAHDHLVRVAQQQAAAGRPRLPTIRQMASDCGVSTVTMWKAVQALKADGTVSAAPRGGVHVVDVGRLGQDRQSQAPGRTRTPPVRRASWEHVLEALRKDILAGAHPAGTALSPYKVLCARYATCYPTMRKALLELAERGRLERHKGRYRVCAPAPRRSLATIVLIARWDPLVDFAATDPARPEFSQVLEREALGLRVKVDVANYGAICPYRTPPSVRRKRLLGLGGGQAVLGYIVWHSGFRDRDMARLLPVLLGTGRPVAVIGDPGWTGLANPPSGRSFLHTFALCSGREAGAAMGTHLRDLGHRKTAYFSPVHAAPWSMQRLEGLRSAFCEPDTPHELVEVVDRTFTDVERVVWAKAGSDTYRNAGALVQFSGERPLPSDSAIRDPFFMRPAQTCLVQRAVLAHMWPLFRSAAADPSVTAWIGANDLVALLALSYLAQATVGVPERVSVGGFDDTIDAFSHGLTSYNFNVPALAHATLEHVLRGRDLRRSGEAQHTTIPGFLMTRRSSGAPRGRQ